MNTAQVHNLADYRKSAPSAAPASPESSDARRASPPIPAPAPAPVANRHADIDIFRPELWHYPAPVALVQWFPARWPVARILDTAIEGLRLFAIAGAAAILAGAILTTLAGSLALATAGVPAHAVGDRVADVSGQG